MKKWIAIPIVGALGIWGISSLRSLSSQESQVSVQEVGPQQETGLFTDAGRVPQSVPQLPPPRVDVAPAEAPQPAPAVFAFREDLESYATLKSKVLPDETEKVRRKELLANARLLRGVGERLRQRPLLDFEDQTAAVDMLVDALRAGDQEASQEALMAIVADGQVEDTSLPRGEREQMAGVKAEVLYHWLAYAPAGSSQVQAALPGPVSRRIWENVRRSHESNLAESRAELARDSN